MLRLELFCKIIFGIWQTIFFTSQCLLQVIQQLLNHVTSLEQQSGSRCGIYMISFYHVMQLGRVCVSSVVTNMHHNEWQFYTAFIYCTIALRWVHTFSMPFKAIALRIWSNWSNDAINSEKGDSIFVTISLCKRTHVCCKLTFIYKVSTTLIITWF